MLVEKVGDWFEVDKGAENFNFSPYMSMTAMVKLSKRDLIPFFTHVDGSSRL